MHILLTGGAGYIGSHASLTLIEAGHQVTIIDDLSTGNMELVPKKANFFQYNINDKNKISKLIKKNNFDALIHFAGFVQVEESVKNPKKYFKNNTDNSIILFETCYENNLKNIIFSSTAAAYGKQNNKKTVSEMDSLNPLNPYGESKINAENYLINNHKNFTYIILRYFNVAGADPGLRTGLISDKATHLIKVVSEVVVGKKDKITIFGNDYNTHDGTAIRDYIHVSDLANIHLKALEYLTKKKISNIFNCGYGNGYSVKEVINEANKITNNQIKYEIGKRRPGDAEILVSNVKKLLETLNWKPKYNNLNLIIKTAIDWEKKINAKNS